MILLYGKGGFELLAPDLDKGEQETLFYNADPTDMIGGKVGGGDDPYILEGPVQDFSAICLDLLSRTDAAHIDDHQARRCE